MTSHRTLCLFAALLLCAGSVAMGQTARAPKPTPSLVVVLGAEMGASCKDADTQRARKLAAACNDKQQCAFTPEVGDEASEACARDSVVLWNCGDGLTRQAALAPQAGQSREIRMECPKTAVAAAEPQKPDAQKSDSTETVKVEGKQTSAALMGLRQSTAPLNMSEAGVDREYNRAMTQSAKGMPGVFSDANGRAVTSVDHTDGQQMLDDLHGNRYGRDDHSANAPLNREGHYGSGL